MINIILSQKLYSRGGIKQLIERQTMRRKIILTIVVVIYVFLAALGLYLGHRQKLPESTAQPYVSSIAGHADTPEDTVVFVTQGGMWYHRGYCRELQKYRIPVKLSVVKEYCKPCTKCRPQR